MNARMRSTRVPLRLSGGSDSTASTCGRAARTAGRPGRSPDEGHRRLCRSSIANPSGSDPQYDDLAADRLGDPPSPLITTKTEATRATAVSTRTYPGADTTTGVAVSRDRLLVTNSQMYTYLVLAGGGDGLLIGERAVVDLVTGVRLSSYRCPTEG
ncbi:hypothetical protein [Streptomyces malaysiensis]|uniref:hypothetical protein n=1 Tax=Streptomyces malaysiensis TaxID=92644 RepID=UPI00114CB43B|nr:hypothetical protein [Streptomyces sp. SPMA113]